MTWDTFTKAIKESGLVSGTQAQILIKLFQRAGCINDISGSTAEKWIAGTRKCKVSSYFPDEEGVNKQRLYKFFNNRPKIKLKKLQQILCEGKDDSTPVDYTTEDIDILCWGLVNQFLDLLEFQRVDMPDSDKSTSDMLSNSEIISDAVENEVVEQRSITSQSVNVYQKETKCITAGAQIAIPQYCRICFCCKNLKGDAKVIYKNIEDANGECKAFGKSVLATDGGDCDKFKVNYGKVRSYEFYRENKILLSKIPDTN